jgi:DNA repair protein RadA/Sms
MVESIEDRSPSLSNRAGGYAGSSVGAEPVSLASVKAESVCRRSSGLQEFDRVLGGGLVEGSAILIGGDPGIGKSTLLLQTAAALSKTQSVLYITGEESISQVSLRAQRLDLPVDDVQVLPETELERILSLAQSMAPDYLVIDSIQTVYSSQMQSAPGSVAQVRECAAQLVRLAKQTKTTVFLVGHVT